jgi:hypothetical protein
VRRCLPAAAVLQHERRCFSFLSVNFGLITNLDIGTEHLRWAGREGICHTSRLQAQE